MLGMEPFDVNLITSGQWFIYIISRSKAPWRGSRFKFVNNGPIFEGSFGDKTSQAGWRWIRKILPIYGERNSAGKALKLIFSMYYVPKKVWRSSRIPKNATFTPHHFGHTGGGGAPTFGDQRPPKVGYRAPKARGLRKISKFWKFWKKLWLKNAIKMNLGDLLDNFFELFLRKMSYLIV